MLALIYVCKNQRYDMLWIVFIIRFSARTINNISWEIWRRKGRREKSPRVSFVVARKKIFISQFTFRIGGTHNEIYPQINKLFIQPENGINYACYSAQIYTHTHTHPTWLFIYFFFFPLPFIEENFSFVMKFNSKVFS